MKRRLSFLLSCALLLETQVCHAENSTGPVVLTAGRSRIALSPANGSILAFGQAGQQGSLFRSGEFGLWQVRFRDGKDLGASSFSTTSQERRFRQEVDPNTGAATMTYRSADLEVAVSVRAQGDSFEFSAELSPKEKTVLEFTLPARLRFSAEELEHLVCPADGNHSVGTAFLGGFFKKQTEPTSWTSSPSGPNGYETLFGSGLVMREVQDPPVPLRVTDEGRTWLGAAMSDNVGKAQATVNRAPQKSQADLVLVDSAHGPYFSASRLGGQGRLWRFGGGIGQAEEELVIALLSTVVDRLAAQQPRGRNKLGVIALSGAPPAGSWSNVRVEQWLDRFRRLAPVQSDKMRLVELRNTGNITQAQASGDFLVILNPYGEWLPVEKTGGTDAAVQAVGRYVRSGGNWFETGGYPFYYELRPADRYYQYGVSYPPAFADFFHIKSRVGTAAVYRMQPRTWEPWQGAGDPRARQKSLPGGITPRPPDAKAD